MTIANGNVLVATKRSAVVSIPKNSVGLTDSVVTGCIARGDTHGLAAAAMLAFKNLTS